MVVRLNEDNLRKILADQQHNLVGILRDIDEQVGKIDALLGSDPDFGLIYGVGDSESIQLFEEAGLERVFLLGYSPQKPEKSALVPSNTPITHVGLMPLLHFLESNNYSLEIEIETRSEARATFERDRNGRKNLNKLVAAFGEEPGYESSGFIRQYKLDGAHKTVNFHSAQSYEDQLLEFVDRSDKVSVEDQKVILDLAHAFKFRESGGLWIEHPHETRYINFRGLWDYDKAAVDARVFSPSGSSVITFPNVSFYIGEHALYDFSSVKDELTPLLDYINTHAFGGRVDVKNRHWFDIVVGIERDPQELLDTDGQ